MTKEIKPDTAPTNISPSKPRFKTPLFSVTNSPIPAKTKGVVEIKTIFMIPKIRS